MTRKQMNKAAEIIKDHGMAEEWIGLTYREAIEYVKGGSLACYYDSARHELAEIYDETEEEAAKYSDSKVWEQYCHVMAMMAGRVKYLA